MERYLISMLRIQIIFFLSLFELVHNVCCLQKPISFFSVDQFSLNLHSFSCILKLPVHVLFLLLFNRNHIPQILDLILICTRKPERIAIRWYKNKRHYSRRRANLKRRREV